MISTTSALLAHTTCFSWHWGWLPRYLPSWTFGWVTLALINAGLGQAKGRSGLFWFLASLLLGPIATLLLVTVYGREKSA